MKTIYKCPECGKNMIVRWSDDSLSQARRVQLDCADCNLRTVYKFGFDEIAFALQYEKTENDLLDLVWKSKNK